MCNCQYIKNHWSPDTSIFIGTRKYLNYRENALTSVICLKLYKIEHISLLLYKPIKQSPHSKPLNSKTHSNNRQCQIYTPLCPSHSYLPLYYLYLNGVVFVDFRHSPQKFCESSLESRLARRCLSFFEDRVALIVALFLYCIPQKTNLSKLRSMYVVSGNIKWLSAWYY